MWSFISYYWNFLPWWSFVVVAIILIAIFWQPILAVWELLPKPIKALITGIAAIFIAVQYGRNRGMKDAQDQRAKDNANAVNTRDKIDETVKHMPPSDVDAGLKRNNWMRD